MRRIDDLLAHPEECIPCQKNGSINEQWRS